MTSTPLVVGLLRSDHIKTAFDLLYVGWFPLDYTSGPQYVITFIMQWITTVPLYTSFVGRIVFINHVKLEFEYQCDKLKYALRTICDRVSKKVILRNSHVNFDVDAVVADVHVERPQRGTKSSSFLLPATPMFFKCDEVEMLKKLAECERHYQQLLR